MDIRQVKNNLGKNVIVTAEHCGVEGSRYLFTGCTIHRDKQGRFYYDAQLADASGHSTIIARLEDISEIQGNTGDNYD